MMKAITVARILGMIPYYQKAVEKIGEKHICNQGCAEGNCLWNEDGHQMEILMEMGKIKDLHGNPAVAVPDGWKLVPVEITDAMADATGCEGRYKLSAHKQAQRIWSAMLAAAPSHSQKSVDKQHEWDGKGVCRKCGVTIFGRRDTCPSHESDQQNKNTGGK